MDSDSNHGGARRGAGRKPKIEEQALIERLSPMDDIALEKLEMLISQGEFNAIKLFFEYRFGKPKQDVDANVSLKNFNIKDIFKFED
jgi:hypothetical protein